MRKEKQAPEKGKDNEYLEIPLPHLDGILDGIRERANDKIAEDVAREIQISGQKGRVGLSPSYARAGYVAAVILLVLIPLAILWSVDIGMYVLIAFVLLLSVALIFLGKYEIRFDDDGFSICLGKKVLRHHDWSEVTEVKDRKKVIVNGKRLFADPSMDGYELFCRRACQQFKRGGKTVASEKKRKNRKKPPTKKSS